MNDALDDLATEMAPEFSLDPATMVQLLWLSASALIRCLWPSEQPSPGDVQGYVESQWRDGKGYPAGLVHRATVQVRREGRKQGRSLTRQQAERIAVRLLDRAREASPKTLRAAMGRL